MIIKKFKKWFRKNKPRKAVALKSKPKEKKPEIDKPHYPEHSYGGNVFERDFFIERLTKDIVESLYPARSDFIESLCNEFEKRIQKIADVQLIQIEGVLDKYNRRITKIIKKNKKNG